MAQSTFSAVDEYGFERHDDFDYESYEDFMSNYLKVLATRAQKWAVLLGEGKSVKRTNTVKRYVRKGIPSEHRPSVWMAISEADRMKDQSPDLFHKILDSPFEKELVDLVKTDLPRTFPDNIYFTKEANHQTHLFNILIAYAHNNRAVGYCQGLNYIAGVLAVHCVIHRQHLVARNLSERLFQSLQYVIKAANKIRNCSLNDRLFHQLCVTNDEDFNRLLFHTEVRRLSRGNCLTRFYNLFDSVIEFLETKDTELRNKLITSKNDIAYMTDLYKLFNNMNLQLQGDELNLIKTKNIVAAFAAKLLLHKKNMGRREFHYFPNLSVSCSNDDLFAYCQHLENLHIDFTERYQDNLNLEIPDWVLDPFSNVNTAISPRLEEVLIELTTNEKIKIKFKNGYQEFWLQKPISQLYPGLWSIVQQFLIAFPWPYLCERGFSAVVTLLTKKRNHLHVTERGDLRLFLSKLEPDINKLIKQQQIHPSRLLLLATKSEETSFWLLKVLVEKILPDYYTKTMDGLIVDIEVLSELVKAKVPDVHQHVINLGLPWAVITTKWFVCLFAEVLPIETVLRIWDCLFYEGSKILFRVCLTLIKSNRAEIMACNDFTSLAECFKAIVKNASALHCHEFMQSIFKVPGTLSNTTIIKLRARFAKQRREQQQKEPR